MSLRRMHQAEANLHEVIDQIDQLPLVSCPSALDSERASLSVSESDIENNVR